MNIIDAPRAFNLWTEVDRNLYNQLPVYMAKQQVEYIKLYDRWAKVLKPYRWTPNMGNLLRGVRKERSPILRGQVIPQPITSLPRKDVIEVREVREDAQLYRQDFDSNVFQFLPSFQDFLTDHVDATNKDMIEKIMVFKDLFYRTAIFHGSPAVWICGYNGGGPELRPAPYWTSPTISFAKTQSYLQAAIATCTQMLTLENIKKLGTVMYNDIGATPYSGDVLPDGSDGKALKHKYCLISGTEVWDSFTDTGSYLLANKTDSLDIVTGPFTGSLFGRWTWLPERFPMHITADGRIVGPETIEENQAEYNYGETLMSAEYVNAPFGIAHACGADAYKSINPGPPPSLFAKGGMSITQFNGMDWNGKVGMTRNVLVPSLDQNNAMVLDTNKRGEYLQLISDVCMGILPLRRRNIVPIIYKRVRIATS